MNQLIQELWLRYPKKHELDSKNSYAYIGLGNVLIQQKKWDEAQTAYDKAIELNPKNVDAYRGLVQQFQRAISLDANYTAAQNNLKEAQRLAGL